MGLGVWETDEYRRSNSQAMKGKGLESSQKKVSCRSVQEAQLCTIEGGSSFTLLVGELCERTIKCFSCGTLQVTLGRFMSHLN